MLSGNIVTVNLSHSGSRWAVSLPWQPCRQRPHCLRGLDIEVPRRFEGRRGGEGETERGRRRNEGSRGTEGTECVKENKLGWMLERKECYRFNMSPSGVPCPSFHTSFDKVKVMLAKTFLIKMWKRSQHTGLWSVLKHPSALDNYSAQNEDPLIEINTHTHKRRKKRVWKLNPAREHWASITTINLQSKTFTFLYGMITNYFVFTSHYGVII